MSETKGKRVAVRSFLPEYAGKTLDRGQVFEMAGAPNDEILLRLGYVQRVPEKASTFRCRLCSAEFIDQGTRAAHGDKRHVERELTPEQEDEAIEREERSTMSQAPLHMDKTSASKGVAAAGGRK